jgi:hypothetical protein
MDGQPVLLIMILAIVAVLQIQGHRPIVPTVPNAPAYFPDEPVRISRCTGIELELGCALNGMLDGAASSSSPR